MRKYGNSTPCSATHGPARLPLVRQLAWHLRQRDTLRAAALVAETRNLMATVTLTERERDQTAATLLLTEG